MTAVRTPTITVHLLVFASYADWLGDSSFDLAVQAPATAADVVREIRAMVPGGDRIPKRPMIAINQVHVQLDAPLAEGDEVALLPPLAGG